MTRMIELFEELIRKETELTEKVGRMEKTNLALILSQQLMHKQVFHYFFNLLVFLWFLSFFCLFDFCCFLLFSVCFPFVFRLFFFLFVFFNVFVVFCCFLFLFVVCL